MSDVLKKCNTCGRQFTSETDFLTNTSRWRLCERGNLWFNCDCNSTIMIIKGKFPWYSPDKFMSDGAKSLFNTLPALQELPHLPTSVMELQQMIVDDNADSRTMAKVSKRDPLIASNILKIANGMKSNPDVVIDSLEHAISYIGLKTLSDIVLTASISAFPFKTKVFDADQFWQDAFLTGKIAEQLSRRFATYIFPDEAYLAGALCNVGKVVMAICVPGQADKISADSRNTSSLRSWSAGEKAYKTLSHTILGEIGATFWGLPDFIMNAACYHHTVNDKADRIEIIDIVKLANQMAHWINLEPHKIDQKLLDSCLSQFKLSSGDLEKLAEEFMPLKASA